VLDFAGGIFEIAQSRQTEILVIKDVLWENRQDRRDVQAGGNITACLRLYRSETLKWDAEVGF
jgi:hypothetical protein